jgi:hypothetical protein
MNPYRPANPFECAPQAGVPVSQCPSSTKVEGPLHRDAVGQPMSRTPVVQLRQANASSCRVIKKTGAVIG